MVAIWFPILFSISNAKISFTNSITAPLLVFPIEFILFIPDRKYLYVLYEWYKMYVTLAFNQIAYLFSYKNFVFVWEYGNMNQENLTHSMATKILYSGSEKKRMFDKNSISNKIHRYVGGGWNGRQTKQTSLL